MNKLIFALTLVMVACAPIAPAQDQGYGANPALPAPEKAGLPVINVARAVGWPAGAAPSAPDGFVVSRFAEDLDHPRWIYLAPNGDVMVAESSTAPSRGGGITGWVANSMQRRAGAFAEGPGRILLLRDTDHDGDVDERHVFAENLNQPLGMVILGDHFYVANSDAVLRFAYASGATSISGAPELVLQLPYRAGDNGHWTRNLIASPGGDKLYVSVGSASNIADGGMEAEEGRAAIWVLNPDGSEARVFASGLRNPVGMDWAPESGVLWTAVNERDMLGDNLVPDYMTSVRDGGFYGWPYSYYGGNVDARVRPQRPDLVATALAPDYALGAHTASLGLHFYRGAALPAQFQGGAFVGQHGSWNRRQPAGYKVIHVPFAAGAPSGPPEDFLTGFLNARGEAQGRPVGVAADATGAILVADDVGDIIWRVAPVG